MGGGTTFKSWRQSIAEGPSPRGRGNQFAILHRSLPLGTIPAWAGEPQTSGRYPRIRWDHPRVGGGTSLRSFIDHSRWGPSPRGRGNPKRPVGIPVYGGTIPAWAGEPALDALSDEKYEDHPRVGGGTEERGLVEGADQGPSPRGRGNHRAEIGAEVLVRTIPAWAGEPVSAGRCCNGQSDHPRVGGGTGDGAVATPAHVGPSPRGRGNPDHAARVVVSPGTIPAWAGEPPWST